MENKKEITKMEKIKLHLDIQSFSEKPNDKETSVIKDRFKNLSSIHEVTIEQLFNCIGNGHTICPAVLKNGTKNENWVQQQLVCIDIDNEAAGEILTPDEAVSSVKREGINTLGYYYTFSNSAAKPKFRLLFLLNKPITNPNEMSFIIETLIDFFPQADKSCKDISRLFYATDKTKHEVKIIDPEARITVKDIKKIAKTEYKICDDLKQLEVVKKQLNDISLNSDIIDKLYWIQCEKNSNKIIFRILCPQLAHFIRNNINYFFVRNNAKSGILRYFYLDGYYKLVTDEEVKGIIKSFIPLNLQKIKDIIEVFKLLETDLKFVTLEKLNSNQNIINFQNGILELSTGKLKPHSPQYLCTIRIPCNYKSKGPIPKKQYFNKFMNDLTNNDLEIKRLILQFMGVILSNVAGYKMKQALFMVGAGDTGKSKIKEFLTSLLGNENCSSLDLKDLEKQFTKIQLLGKRLVGSNDMSYMTISELETFKKITGGDHIYGEYKGENGIDFIFHGVLWFCGNQLPKFRRR